jgi:hypothetical protein
MALWQKVVGFFTGGSKAAEKVIDMVDESVMTTEEKAKQDTADTADARADMRVPATGRFDSFIEGLNRVPRPAFAVWAFGELVGWWDVPIGAVEPEKMQLIMLIITFYFGGRVILKDLPSVIKALRTK